MEFEARYLARRLTPAPAGSGRRSAAPAWPVVLRRIGLGGTQLAALAPELAAVRPTGVLVTGLAGGCAPDLRPGELVVATATASAADGAWLAPDSRLLERAVAAVAVAGIPHRVGPLLTVPEPLTTPAAKAGCWERRGAVAVDMESARVLRWAHDAALPALAVRAVADGPADPLPPALAAVVGPGGRMRPSALLAWATHPALAGSAWRLWRRSRLALDRLACFLSAFTAVRP